MNVSFHVQELFFDRMAVTGAVDRATRGVLSKFGAYVRRTAKGSIRKAKGPSMPGRPPHSHKGFLREFIFFHYNPGSRSVVIGPALFARSTDAQRVLEHGGMAKVRNVRRRKRLLGGSGEIRVNDGRSAKSTKQVACRNGTAEVTYAKLFTAAQVDRANLLNAELYGPEFIPGVRIEPRPYMGPAFAKEAPKLPQMWRDSIKA
jgi:hypothetical protein